MNKKESKNLERNICILVGVLFIIALIGTFKSLALLPTTLLLLALELLTIAYFQKEDKEKLTSTIILFGVSVFLIIFSTLYTVIKIV